ncbi:MAG: hypothetical protein EBR82_86740 [Caulobacteraceae bacterium]|nr:hypothetical protein [Caulobacteraceae bacterium]
MQTFFGEITLQDMRASRQITEMVMPMVARACAFSGGRWTPEDVADGLIDGRFRLWGVMALPKDLQAVAVTFLEPEGKPKRAMELLLLGGPDMRAMFRFLPQLTKQAQAQGAKVMRVHGKRGWQEHMGDDWKPVTVMYEQALGEARQD